MQDDKSCIVCGVRSAARCGKCKQVYYCGDKHQRSDWVQHKSTCVQSGGSVGGGSVGGGSVGGGSVGGGSVGGANGQTPPLNMVYIPGHVRNPAPPADVIKHSSRARLLMQLAWPCILGMESTVKNFAGRCFISVEVSRSDVNTPVPGFPFVVHEAKVVSAESSSQYAEITESQKLVSYCSDYTVGKQLPCLVWCRDPNVYYTALIVPPWVVREFMNWSDVDNL